MIVPQASGISDVQWWIDTLGKLGPMFVAAAVLLTTIGQNRWNNSLATRSSNVKDQELRLALLERRAVAIDTVRAAAEEFHTKGAATREAVEQIYSALKVAELVFDDDLEQQISTLLKALLRWQAHERASARWRDADDEKLRKAVDAMMDAEDEIVSLLTRLQDNLIASSKVRQVEPLERRSWRALIANQLARRGSNRQAG